MEKMPVISPEPSGEKSLPVAFRGNEEFDVPIAYKKENKSGLLDKIRKAIGIGSIGLAALTGEGCAPDKRSEQVSGGGEPSTTHAEKNTSFSGYGVRTETKDGQLKNSSYGSERNDGKRSFKGYGIER